jgi:hypothetical protein
MDDDDEVAPLEGKKPTVEPRSESTAEQTRHSDDA